jgi:hypothetical protein
MRASANNDETKFERPEEFDIFRFDARAQTSPDLAATSTIREKLMLRATELSSGPQLIEKIMPQNARAATSIAYQNISQEDI